MQLQPDVGIRATALGLVCLVVVGCGPGPGKWWALTGEEDVATSAGSSTSLGESPTGSGSAADQASTGGSTGGSTSDGSMSHESSSGGSTGVSPDSTSGSSTASDASEAETADVPACGRHGEEAACLRNGCQPVTGRHFGGDEAIACLEAEEWLDCIEPTACADEVTTVCDGEEKYQLASTCAPDGWVTCIPPPDQGMNGYPNCP